MASSSTGGSSGGGISAVRARYERGGAASGGGEGGKAGGGTANVNKAASRASVAIVTSDGGGADGASSLVARLRSKYDGNKPAEPAPPLQRANSVAVSRVPRQPPVAVPATPAAPTTPIRPAAIVTSGARDLFGPATPIGLRPSTTPGSDAGTARQFKFAVQTTTKLYRSSGSPQVSAAGGGGHAGWYGTLPRAASTPAGLKRHTISLATPISPMAAPYVAAKPSAAERAPSEVKPEPEPEHGAGACSGAGASSADGAGSSSSGSAVSSPSASVNFFDKLRGEAPVVTEEQVRRTVKKYDTNGDGVVNRKEFNAFITDLLVDAAGKPYPLSAEQVDHIFDVLDDNSDGAIDASEFVNCWNRWVAPLNNPKTALIVVDVQNDFISGSLALRNCPAKDDGAKVVPVINKLRKENKFDVVVFTLDSHPADHCSFHSNVHKHALADDTPVKASDAKLFDIVRLRGPPPVDQKLWPSHCVQGTRGEELHEDLIVDEETDVMVHKGTKTDVDSYSAFWDNAKLSETSLLKQLQEKQINTVFVCGLAYDVCVGSTALHAAEHGFRTIVVEDACAGVTHEGIAEMKKALTDSGCLIVQSNEVHGLNIGKDRDSATALGTLKQMRLAKENNLKMADHIRMSLSA